MRHYFKNDLVNLIAYTDLRTKKLQENDILSYSVRTKK